MALGLSPSYIGVTLVPVVGSTPRLAKARLWGTSRHPAASQL